MRPGLLVCPDVHTHCQVVVVLSGSMEPGFYRGDILFLNMGHKPIRVGEVVVFNLDNRDIPIVHRVIKVHETEPGGEIKILTKVIHLIPYTVHDVCRQMHGRCLARLHYLVWCYSECNFV